MKLKDISIGKRLGLGFAVFVGIIVILVVIGALGMSRLNNTLTEFAQVNMTKIGLVTTIKEKISGIDKAILFLVAAKDQANKEDALKRIDEARAEYKKALEALGQLEKQADAKALMAAINDALVTGKQANAKVIELASAGKAEEAASLYATATVAVVQKANSACNDLVKFYEKDITSNSSNAELLPQKSRSSYRHGPSVCRPRRYHELQALLRHGHPNRP